jgi:predicted short-subunit dehydrogenase-like oxidoreductase (DUF2520 family)
MIQYNISFAGAGRVAGALCRELFKSGIKIIQVISESESDGRPLADACNASWSSGLSFDDQNNVIIVAVPDHSLKNVLASIRCPKECLIVHTAGSYGLEMFPSRFKETGVFYPLQTFSKGREISFKELPFLLEASGEVSGKVMIDLAVAIGGKVQFVDCDNFTNYMLTAGNEIASLAGLSLEIFEPLINETISKALDIGPEESQTGPAVRNDLNTIQKHLKLLSFSPELQSTYSQMTESIIKHYNKRL